MASEDKQEPMTEDALRLHSARYAFHSIICRRYSEAMARGEMDEAEARERYEKAMRNYDGIVAIAPSGDSYAANETSMAKGFQPQLDAFTRSEEGAPAHRWGVATWKSARLARPRMEL